MATNANLPSTLLDVRNLKTYFYLDEGEVRAVDDVTVRIDRGRVLGVVGESGSGKTTLGMALLRLQSSQGDISFESNALQGLPNKDLRPYRRQMQIVFQDPFGSLSPRLSVGQIIAEGLQVHAIGTEAEREKLIADTLARKDR